jgi:P27 family predicted phage terminase small subunit
MGVVQKLHKNASVSDTASPPAHLSADARAWWVKIVSTWEIEDADLLVLGAGLTAYDRAEQARRLIEAEGIVIDSPQGRKSNPAILTERDSRVALLRALRQLGLDGEVSGPVGRPTASSRRLRS